VELIFLGTGAGELWPSAFCECEACRKAVRERGAGARIGSCLLVDGAFLFDLPPNAGLAAVQQGVSLAGVRRLFVTHSHQDHFDPCVLAATGRAQSPALHLYCNSRLAELLPVYARFNRFFDPAPLNLDVKVLAPGDVVTCGEDGFTLTALAANHDRTGGEAPLIYAFERGGKALLYACDTGLPPEATWAGIEKRSYDAVILECTLHERDTCAGGHLSLGTFLEVKERLEAKRLVKPGGRVIAQHLASGHGAPGPPPKELSRKFEEHGVVMAFDGMRVTV